MGGVKLGGELENQSEGFVGFAGLLEVSPGSFAKATKVVRTNSAYAIICSNRATIILHESIYSIVLSAFPHTNTTQQVSIDWLRLALDLCTQGDILIRVSGLFDDHEASVDLIAVKGVLRAS
jgi:hypothetical protein